MKQTILFITGLVCVTIALMTLSLASRSGLGGEIGYGFISFVATVAAFMLWGNLWSEYGRGVEPGEMADNAVKSSERKTLRSL